MRNSAALLITALAMMSCSTTKPRSYRIIERSYSCPVNYSFNASNKLCHLNSSTNKVEELKTLKRAKKPHKTKAKSFKRIDHCEFILKHINECSSEMI